MKVVGSPSIPSSLRLGLTLTIVLMVMSSPILIFLNPVLISAKSNNIDTSGQHSAFSLDDTSSSLSPPSSSSPTNVSPMDSDFTTQAAIGSLTARPTNNIVNTKSFYDVVFVTSTSGAIKRIQVTFPVGTTVPTTAVFNEAEKCVPGGNCTLLTGSASVSGRTVTYTINNAVIIPAGTKIRLEFSNINNPLSPSANYRVTVTTRNAANAIIDGPTPSTAYTMKQIGTNVIADFSITNSKLGTFSVTNSKIANDALSLPISPRDGLFVDVPPGTVVSASASCLSGEELVGGGTNSAADISLDLRYFDGNDITGFNTWTVRIGNAGSGNMDVQAIAYCIPSSFP